MKSSKKDEEKRKQLVRGSIIFFVTGALMIAGAIAGKDIGVDGLGSAVLFIFGFIFVCAAGLGAPEP
ncbi:MAG: hypothetical protein WCV80_03585 [Candidatus Paceibacterota bacterium]